MNGLTGDAEMLPYNPCDIAARTPSERLTQKKQHLESELKKVNAAIDALAKNPELTAALDTVALALG